MNKLAIIHFMPMEYYPPITNLLNHIADYHFVNNLRVYSCNNTKNRKEFTITKSTENTIKQKIFRFSAPEISDHILMRFFKYLKFNIYTFFSLVSFMPNNILYYESKSAWAVFLYTKYINRKCNILIHYHEYSPEEWYLHVSGPIRYFHHLEKKWTYYKAIWISQTNNERLKLFNTDHPDIKPEILKVLPNYPPKSWHSISCNIRRLNKPHNNIKVVYIGSLSIKNTYIKEFCDWVILQKGKVFFSVYSYFIDIETKLYLENIQSEYINFIDGGIEYDEIPNILSRYDVGVILYKPFSLNFINNVTNKFYEYYACGIDIWFSKTMKSTYQHINPETYPRVIPIDFTRMNYFNWQKATNKNGLQKNNETFYCENAYKELVEELAK